MADLAEAPGVRLATPAAVPAPALDETMLAMDVVDTLRHADRLVERELEGDARRDALRTRLREIYASQGIDVPDRIIDQGVAALEEHRFTYRPTPPSFARTLAELYATRASWGRLALFALVSVLVLGGAYRYGVYLPHERRVTAERQELAEGLPRALQAEYDRVLAASSLPAAREQAQRLLNEGKAAAAAGALADGRARLTALQDLQRRLTQHYEVRIVSRPGEQSGVWRTPQGNPNARNFYLIVEAVDPAGKVVGVPVTSEEDGSTAVVTKWGLRVPAAEYERVRADKLRDGVIGQPVVGVKPAGALQPTWSIPVTGSAILKW